MIFTQDQCEQVLDGFRTFKLILALSEPDGTGTFDCEMLNYPNGQEAVQRFTVKSGKWRTIWQVGRIYAVQTALFTPALGHIRITAIERPQSYLWKIFFELVKE